MNEGKANHNVSAIIRKVYECNTVLFLGSGINKGCKNSKGEDAPQAEELARLIKMRFFPDEELENDLATVCDCAEARESRIVLSKFIYDILIDFKPSEKVLKKIPNYNWRRIYTTNFDRLLEQSFESASNAESQKLHPIYSDRSIQDFYLGTDLPYFKLHGCITQIANRDFPLILTHEDYAKHRDSRIRLFSRLMDDLFENTILFIGYSFKDTNFQNLFFEVQDSIGDIRDFPRCYAISPGVPKPVVDFWDTKKVVILNL